MPEKSGKFELSSTEYAALLPKRPHDAHKGDFGSCLIIAGSTQYMGAALLTAKAALRSGVGLVHLMGSNTWTQQVITAFPELIYHELEMPKGCFEVSHSESVQQVINAHNIRSLAIGPGLGRSEESSVFLRTIMPLCQQVPNGIVLDADALYLLTLSGVAALETDVVVTPHPKEAADFFDLDKPSTDEARLRFVEMALKGWSHTLVLKGSRTLIAQKREEGAPAIVTNPSGNSGLATAGSGDVLTGLIAGLMCQGQRGFESACLGVYCHGRAAQLAESQLSQRSLVASDILHYLGATFLELEKSI